MILSSVIKLSFPIRLLTFLDETTHFVLSKKMCLIVCLHLSHRDDQTASHWLTLCLLGKTRCERKQVSRTHWYWYHLISDVDCLPSSELCSDFSPPLLSPCSQTQNDFLNCFKKPRHSWFKICLLMHEWWKP